MGSLRKKLHQKTTVSIFLIIFAISGITIFMSQSQGTSMDSRSSASSTAPAGKLDLLDFMTSNYNIGGLTNQNSSMGIIDHHFDKGSSTWKHSVFSSTCPSELGNNCDNLNWKFDWTFRQKQGENILLFQKNLTIPSNVETFIYNKDWVYVLEEPYTCTNGTFGCLHNFYGYTYSDPNLAFPYRGQVWYTRYFNKSNPGQVIEVPDWKINQYKDMQLYSSTTWPYRTVLQSTYYPNYDTSLNTWNSKSENGNLPNPLEAVVIENKFVNSNGQTDSKEKYTYARNQAANGSYNSFGMIRYESWSKKITFCGSDTCCTNVCDGDLVLTSYISAVNMVSQPVGWDRFLARQYYNDPKITDTLTNGALPRGKFKLPGAGTTAENKSLPAGTWVTLSDIPLDADWIVSSMDVATNTECPDGYQYVGSFVADFCSHKNLCVNGGWTIICGTNKNALLAETCPANYSSRGSFVAGPEANDYLRNDVGNKTLNFCVNYNEFHYPQMSSTCTPACTGKSCGSDGCGGTCGTCSTGKSCNASFQCVITPASNVADINIDGVINGSDYNLFVTDYLKYRNTGTNTARSDLNSDGKVNGADYNTFVVEYLKARQN